MTETTYTPYQGFDYATIHDFPQSDNIPNNSFWGSRYPVREVVVPESYHVGAYHSPTSHKDKDRHWVNEQNPQSYTIQISEDERAASVANKLTIAPKDERRAEIKTYKDGKTYYKGLYGSYKTKEEAEKALENLPPELKTGAGVTNWGTVQMDVQE